jgi:endonuclease/exonuclease/phosphatase family metal-dependent hydrolase
MKIIVISANMWLLPQPFSIQNKERIKKFHDVVDKYKPDIIFLQEVWLNNDVDYINNIFKNYYFVYKKNHLFNETGLLILSKFTPVLVEKHNFVHSKNSAIYDRFAKKGWLFARFRVKNEILDVLNTQLNCPINQKQKYVWTEQYSELKSFIDQNSANLLLAGDINGEHEDLISKSAKAENLSKSSSSYSQNNIFNKRGFHKFTWRFFNYDLDIDNVLLFTKRKTDHMTKRILTDVLVSDHYPILVEVNY